LPLDRQFRRRCWASVLGLCCFLSCSKEPAPTAPDVVLSRPFAQLVVTIDGASPRTVAAIPGSSVVAFDASGSVGERLFYHVDFGDGATADSETGSHVYGQPDKSYRIRLTVTNGDGGIDRAEVPITVGDFRPLWVTTSFDEGRSRSVVFAEQAGSAVSGTFFDGTLRPFHGELTPGRGVILRLDDRSAVLSGAPPEGFDAQISEMRLVAIGGRDSGRTL